MDCDICDNYEEGVVTDFYKTWKSVCEILLNSSKEDFDEKEEWYIENSTDDLRREVRKIVKNNREGKALKKVTFDKKDKTLVHPKKKIAQENQVNHKHPIDAITNTTMNIGSSM